MQYIPYLDDNFNNDIGDEDQDANFSDDTVDGDNDDYEDNGFIAMTMTMKMAMTMLMKMEMTMTMTMLMVTRGVKQQWRLSGRLLRSGHISRSTRFPADIWRSPAYSMREIFPFPTRNISPPRSKRYKSKMSVYGRME